MATIKLGVDGMTCGGCVKGVQNALNSYDGVSNATADLDDKSVSIDYDDTQMTVDQLHNAIEDAGFSVIG